MSRPAGRRAPARGARLASRVVPALALSLIVAGCQSAPHPSGGVSGAGSSGASHARGWKPSSPDSFGPVVAVVGNRRITAHDIDSLIASAPPNVRDQFTTPEGYRSLVDRAVTEEAVYQAARAAGADKDPAYQAEASRSARDILLRRYYQGRMAAMPPVPDSTIQAFYDAHKEEYVIQPRARVRHILLATRAKAEAIRHQLSKGGLWDALCRANSIDAATKTDGGILGFVTPDVEYVPGVGKAPSIIAAAFALKEGETSQPLKSDKGWHLIRVESVEPRGYQPLAAVRAQIEGQISTERESAFSKALLDSLKDRANATVFAESIEVAVRPAKSPQDYFKEAQAATSPQKRIELYRTLVNRFPNDSVTVQAEFMIGFTYAEDLGDTDQAREEFQKFLEHHPKHELATSARWMMDNMDKPAPELDEGAPGDSVDTGGQGATSDSTRSVPHQGSKGSQGSP